MVAYNIYERRKNMKKVKKILAIAMVGASILTATLTTNAAGCGNWYIETTYDPTCIEMSCGPGLGLPLHRQKLRWERACVNNANDITYEHKTTYKGLGCC